MGYFPPHVALCYVISPPPPSPSPPPQLRKMFRRRYFAATTINKMARGKLVRLGFHYVRLRHFVTNRAAKVIVRILRECLVRRARRADLSFQYPNDEWARRHLGKKLACLIWEKMQGWGGRRRLAEAYQAAAPPMQMLVRGYLSRQGVKRVKYVRNAMREWCQPGL